MTIEEEVQHLLKEIGPGKMSNTAYDTAWVARLGEVDWELSNQALNWLCEHQLSDGSWGAEQPFYYHDRVISTLSAMIALTYRGRRAKDRFQIEKGLQALERITSGATQGLASDPNGATVGFEMIAPTLVAEAEKLGIIQRQGERILGRLGRLRIKKMDKLKGQKINRFVTPAFSIEMAGLDGKAILDIDNLQESNGSIANSPSATAYFAMHLKHNDPEAMAYIRKWTSTNGGVPDVAPFDIFEPAWALWNLQLISGWSAETITLFQRHLDYLQKHWNNDTGIGHASEYTPKDSDDSGLVLELMLRFNREANLDAIFCYEESEYFRCFALEANPSISANIHVLGALRQACFDRKHPSIQKILLFLRSMQNEDGYLLDKWHVSPYYTTSHAIIACIGYDDVICSKAIEWILESQNANGSWGLYRPNAEETAYAIQALVIWKRSGNSVSTECIDRGIDWLNQNSAPPYEPLWIGKALYCPEFVVRSAILSAQSLAREG